MKLKIVSWNLNGLLSCVENKSFEPIKRLNPDLVFLQEIKTHQQPTIIENYEHVFFPAERDGYSGSALLYKKELAPIQIIKGFHAYPPDTEGRVITVELGGVYVVGVYVPNSQANIKRRDYRLAWDNNFYNHIKELLWEKPVIICGDFNLVMSELDVYDENDREKRELMGYLSDEQSGFQTLLDLGLKDVFRSLCPNGRIYTWWSNRLHKRDENRGWRLDYFLVDESIFDSILGIAHYTDIHGSDHCPVELYIEVSDNCDSYENATSAELERRWNSIDWENAEKRLEFLQQQITFAAFERDNDRIVRLQSELVRDLRVKCLAVRKVTSTSPTPGVDGVRWKTAAQKMAAALSLTSKDYHAKPFRQIQIVAKNNGKIRRPSLPTYFDRTMSVLYGYSLLPVTEAWSERKSFAFRQGRSAQDAHAYIMEALEKDNAPRYMVCVDVKGYYAHIQHDWILANVPMDKKVLREFLDAGIIFAGELFPADDIGISEGFSISPYIGNFVLDGLQKYIFEGLYGDNYHEKDIDYTNGNLIRFADDILVQARNEETAEFCLELVKEFLEKRGLTISEEKTRIRDITDGFSYLSRTYKKQGGIVSARPSDSAVERFKADITETILTCRKSQRELIQLVNAKLRGWAGYHRCTDALNAFHEIDNAVRTALIQAASAKHPKLPLPKVLARYWYKEPDGRSSYALPDDKTVRVIWLRDTMLTDHNKLNTNINPFLDKDKLDRKTHIREIANVTGKYKVIWERQNGKCYYCGKRILQDQERTVVPLDLSKPSSVYNSAYIHKICELNEFEIINTDKDLTYLRPVDVQAALTELLDKKNTKEEKSINERGEITPQWKYYALKEFFSKCNEDEVALTFTQIEKIIGFKLPTSARKYISWWSTQGGQYTISIAWTSEHYFRKKIDFKGEKIYFQREDGNRVDVPKVLLGNIPLNAKLELEQFCDYLIKKYGLKDTKSKRKPPKDG